MVEALPSRPIAAFGLPTGRAAKPSVSPFISTPTKLKGQTMPLTHFGP